MKKPIMTLPCKMQLSDLESTPSGFHCANCQKTLIDFRTKSTNEVHETIVQESGRVCGIFHRDQFDYKTTTYSLSSLSNSVGLSLLGILGFVSPLLTGCGNDQQDKAAVEAQKKAFKHLKFPMHVQGMLTEEQTGKALPHAAIQLQQNGETIRTVQTDQLGHFDFVINRGDLKQETFHLIFGSSATNKDTLFNQHLEHFSKGKQLRLTLKAEAGKCVKKTTIRSVETITTGDIIVEGIEAPNPPLPPPPIEIPEPPVLLGEPSVITLPISDEEKKPNRLFSRQKNERKKANRN